MELAHSLGKMEMDRLALYNATEEANDPEGKPLNHVYIENLTYEYEH